METGLKDKTVLITASSTGIGKAVAELFAQEGCRIAISSRSKENLLFATQELKDKYSLEPFWSVCDLNKQKDIENTFSAVTAHFGTVDILVNNCGGPTPGLFQQLEEEDWNFAYEQVLLSVVRFSKLVLPGMMAKNWGRIINLTSISVKQPVDNLVLSNSLRAGVTGLTKSLSNEVAKFNITVNNVLPGATETERLTSIISNKANKTGQTEEQVAASMASAVPMKRFAKPEEVANAVAFLASPAAAYINGINVPVDGGRTGSL